MHDFKKLEVWQKSIELPLLIYNLTSKFPKDEIFGLTSQMRRCTVSISSNISEGAGRGQNWSFVVFYISHMDHLANCILSQ